MNNIFLEEINPELFTYELWEANCWDALDLTFAESMEVDRLMSKIKEYGIGYCDSSRLTFRSLGKNYFAVMCEKDGRKFWFHVYKYDFDEYAELIN